MGYQLLLALGVIVLALHAGSCYGQITARGTYTDPVYVQSRRGTYTDPVYVKSLSSDLRVSLGPGTTIATKPHWIMVSLIFTIAFLTIYLVIQVEKGIKLVAAKLDAINSSVQRVSSREAIRAPGATSMVSPLQRVDTEEAHNMTAP